MCNNELFPQLTGDASIDLEFPVKLIPRVSKSPVPMISDETCEQRMNATSVYQ
jgi:hypothetical protein